jgi:UDP-galactopyranose mutase
MSSPTSSSAGALLDERRKADLLIVGAGFYGATMAKCLVTQFGRRVMVIDRRSHVGGNAYSSVDPQTGIEVHSYGAHVFHTSNKAVWDYLSGFSALTNDRHRVFTRPRDGVYSMPIDLGTICQFFGRHLTSAEARRLVAEPATELRGQSPRNLEEKAISLVGRPLYEAFIPGYTAKQWQSAPQKTTSRHH